MKILVVDGQGGGIGRALVERIRAEMPELPVIALGTNVMATSAMLRAGASQGATGENAICHQAKSADIILGPTGIVAANSMLGELSPQMAVAIAGSGALKILLPVGKCQTQIAGASDVPLGAALDDAIRLLRRHIEA